MSDQIEINDQTGAIRRDPLGLLQPRPGFTVRPLTDEEATYIGQDWKWLVFRNGALIRAAPELTLTQKLRLILARLKSEAARTKGIELAAQIEWALDNGHAADVPGLIRACDPGDDPELTGAKAQALALF